MKWIFLALLFMPLVVKSQTLHAILVSDVEDPKLGGVSLRDEGKILDILTTAEWGTGLKLKTYYHNRATFTVSAIRETLDNLPVQSQDVVFFYYTGLGHYPEKSDAFPTFKLKESLFQPVFVFFNQRLPLSLNEVGEILHEKGARLNIVMADCRDAALPPLYIDWQPEQGTSVEEDVKKVFLKKLFLGSCGLVKVASARSGQKVWAEVSGKPVGSLYTEKFFRNFEKMLDPPKTDGNIEPLSRFAGIRQATWNQLAEFESVLPPEHRIFLKNSPYPDSDGGMEDSFEAPIFEQPGQYHRYRSAVRQKPIVETGTCTSAQRRLTTPYPSYRNSATANEIRDYLKAYLCPYPPQQAYLCNKNFAELYQKVYPAFHPSATIQLIRKNKYPANYPEAKRIAEQMSIKDFITHFKNPSATMKHVDVDVASLKRTPNKEYLTALTIIETYEELKD